MAVKRKDKKGRNLKDNESQMLDGRYRFRYIDKQGKRQAVYSWRLVPTDKAPAGKRDSLSLREKEEAIQRDIHEGIDSRKAATTTLNDMFELYMFGKHELKTSTRTNYQYMYKNYVSECLGKKKIKNIILTLGGIRSQETSRQICPRRIKAGSSISRRCTSGMVSWIIKPTSHAPNSQKVRFETAYLPNFRSILFRKPIMHLFFPYAIRYQLLPL